MDTDLRCPACGARTGPDAPWCTLCFHDLRAPGAVAGEDAAVAPAAGPVEPVHLASRPAGIRLPLVSDVLAGPGGQLVVMVGGTVLLSVGGVAVMSLVGVFL